MRMAIQEHRFGHRFFSAAVVCLVTIATAAVPRSASSQAAGATSAVLHTIPSTWTELERKKGGEYEILAYCDAGPRTLELLDLSGPHPRLEVFLGQESQSFEILSAVSVTGVKAPTIRMKLQPADKSAAVREIQIEYQDASRGLGIWSEVGKSKGPSVILFEGKAAYASQEKLGLYKRRKVNCDEGGEVP